MSRWVGQVRLRCGFEVLLVVPSLRPSARAFCCVRKSVDSQMLEPSANANACSAARQTSGSGSPQKRAKEISPRWGVGGES